MKKNLSYSELILNDDQSIYHLKLRSEHLKSLVITVGDPNRVPMVSKHFDQVEFKISNREFHTHGGTLNGKSIMVISTGIGTGNIDIVINELDALSRFDFDQRLELPQPKSLTIARIGTSGALHSDIPIDSFLISEYALGMDGIGAFYNNPNSEALKSYEQEIQALELPVMPYLASSDELLISQAPAHFQRGFTLTAPGFYAPQGRNLQGQNSDSRLFDKLLGIDGYCGRLTNIEMETAAILRLGKLLGHRCLSFNALLANRSQGTFSKTPKDTVERLIVKALDYLVSYEN